METFRVYNSEKYVAGFVRCKPWLDGVGHAADFTFSRIILG